MRLIYLDNTRGEISVWEDRNEIAGYAINGEVDLDTVLELMFAVFDDDPFDWVI